MVLDPAQLARIEATHTGFLYQHLFAAALLLVDTPDAGALLVETDEDVEIRTPERHWYTQVKCLTDVLQPSDVRPILDRFELLRAEHTSGRRQGVAHFAIVSRSEPSQSLDALLLAPEWPADVEVVTPLRGHTVLGVPACASILDAIQWTVTAAAALPFSRLTPDTLVWKLAAHVQMIASGKLQGGSHEILFSEVPRLREQLDLYADLVPEPPTPYLPQVQEPPINTPSRIRLIVGVSGSGKTSWLSATSAHLGSIVVFMRASEGAPDVASWIVRHLAAMLLRNSNETLAAVFRPGAVPSESLRLIDRLADNTPTTVAIDNAHLLSADALSVCIQTTAYLRWILLSRPGPETTLLEARLSIVSEHLSGWAEPTIASVLASLGIPSTLELAQRLLRVTGGLPLFVIGAAQVAKAHYSGDLTQLLDEQSRGQNTAQLPQETIIARDVVRYLSAGARLIGALVLSLRSDIPNALLNRLGVEALSLGASASVAIRELVGWHVLRPGRAGTTAVHDAFRPALYAERAAMDSALREAGLRFLLSALRELRATGAWSVDLLLDSLRLLIDLGDGRAFIDIVYGGLEWLTEYGAQAEIEVLSTDAQRTSGLSEEFQFLAADALAYFALQRGDAINSRRWIAECEKIAALPILANPDWEARLATKYILYAGQADDYPSARAAFDLYRSRWAELNTEGDRVVRYDLAVAAKQTQHLHEAVSLLTEIIGEYFDMLNLSPGQLFGKNVPDLMKEVDIVGNEDEIRHFADCLLLRAVIATDTGRHPGFDPPWAMKLYEAVGAYSSMIRAALEWSNSFVATGETSHGLKLLEETIFPLIARERLMGSVVPAGMAYALALVRAGRLADAKRQLESIEVLVPSLPHEDQHLFQRRLDELAAAEKQFERSFAVVPENIRSIDRQRYDAYHPYRHPLASSLADEIAWYERTDGTAIGLILHERDDNEYGWVVQRDAGDQFRVVNLNMSYDDIDSAVSDLMNALLNLTDPVTAHAPNEKSGSAPESDGP